MYYRKNKYRNCKVTTESGETFDSRKEYQYYNHLLQQQEEGKIRELQKQVKFVLIPKQQLKNPVKGKSRTTRSLSAVNYIADFTYISNEDNVLHVIDTKSPVTKTKDYIIKKKMLKFFYDLEIEEV